MLVQHIALVPATSLLSPAEAARVAAALQKQVLRDFAPHWQISAGVDVFLRLQDVPIGYEPILVTWRGRGAGAKLYLDEFGQACAEVQWSPHWSVDASRACLELLVNPRGERSVALPSPRAEQGLVQVLLEVCAPCGEEGHAYAIDGVLVSDFATPAFFGRDEAVGQRPCSFHGSLAAPLQPLRGGHLTWFDVDAGQWWRRRQRGTALEDTRLWSMEGEAQSGRERTLPSALGSGDAELARAFAQRAETVRARADAASKARARRLSVLAGLSAEQAQPLPGADEQESSYAAVQDHELEVELAPDAARVSSPRAHAESEREPPDGVPSAAAPAGPPAEMAAQASAAAFADSPVPALSAEQVEAALRPAPVPTQPEMAVPLRFAPRKREWTLRVYPAAEEPATSSIAPVASPSPAAAPKTPQRRTARLWAAAALVGLAFFGLALRERRVAPAHAASDHSAPKASASSAPRARATSTALLQRTATAPSHALAPLAPVDAGALPSTALADAGAAPVPSAVAEVKAAPRPARKRRVEARSAAAPRGDAGSAPSRIEDLFDTRQ